MPRFYQRLGLLIFTDMMSLEVKISQNDRFLPRNILEVRLKVTWLVGHGWWPSAVQGEGFNAGLGTGKIGREMYMLEQGRNISPFNMSLA